jgi:tetratricopeptide (TPR) repeat protein
MNEFLPTIYLSCLLVLLATVSIFVVRQILKTRRIESTFSNLQKKINKGKATAQEYYELGSIYLDKKLFVQAIQVLNKALKIEGKLEPENRALIYNAIGFAYFAQEQYDLAIRQYKEALKANPGYITALNNLGNVYEKKQLTAQALEIYEQTLQYDANNTVAKRRAESLRKRLVTS